MTRINFEARIKAADEARKAVDWNLFWGRFHSLRAKNQYTYEEIDSKLMESYPDYKAFANAVEAVYDALPIEPWSNKDIELVLEFCHSKSTCFGSGYRKEKFFRALRRYPLTSKQIAKLILIFQTYVSELPGRRELFCLVSTISPYATLHEIEMLRKAQLNQSSERRRSDLLHFEQMILNQRKDLR